MKRFRFRIIKRLNSAKNIFSRNNEHPKAKKKVKNNKIVLKKSILILNNFKFKKAISIKFINKLRINIE